MNDEDLGIYQANLMFNNALNTLSHYGVAGMKWGVRNEDTLRKYNGGTGVRRGQATRSKRREGIVSRFMNDRREKKRASLRQQQQMVDAMTYKVTGQLPADSRLATSGTPGASQISSQKSGGYRVSERTPSRLSDDDLRAANQRLADEISYKQRQAQLRELSMSKSQRRIANVKKEAVSVGKGVLKAYATKQLSAALDNKFGTKKVKDTTEKVADTVKNSPSVEKTKTTIFESVTNVSENTPIKSYMYNVKGSDLVTYSYTPENKK